MLTELMRRAERIAAQAQQSKVDDVARRLRALFGAGAIEAEAAQVIVAGKGLIRRWLTDPALRFLGGLK